MIGTARKLAAILVADVVGFSWLAGQDEEGTLARLRTLRSDCIEPTVAAHGGRIVKWLGDGLIAEFRSAVEATRCAVDLQTRMKVLSANVPEGERIVVRIGVHVGDVVEEADGDLMGDAVNIAARLQAICEPGGVALSEDAWRHARDRVGETFVDLGEQSLKNIARPVRAFAIRTAPPTQAWARPSTCDAPRLSMVVLPFANIGGGSEQDDFVDGVTESLTTDLSRIYGAVVIGRSTAFTYKGRPVDVKQVGRELNVRYVLEGSVQRAGQRMRVNVQLIEAATGGHLWAERFDKPVGDLFDMQDDIVARLAGALDAQMVAAEARRAERSPAPDSMDLYFQGRAWVSKGAAPAYQQKAREFFGRALALDPNNMFARVGAISVDMTMAAAFMADDRASRFAAAEAELLEILSIVPDLAFAHQQLGVILMYTNRVAEGVAACERALAINRNLASAHAYIGLAKVFAGRAEETAAHIAEALRLSPRDANAHIWIAFSGLAEMFLGDDEGAVTALRRAIETNRNFSFAHFCLAAALARLGRRNEAEVAACAGLALDPSFTVGRFRSAPPSDNPTFLEQQGRACEGMLLAGIPER